MGQGLSWACEIFLDLPGRKVHVDLPGIKPVSPVLAGGFFTTEPQGKPLLFQMGKAGNIRLKLIQNGLEVN